MHHMEGLFELNFGARVQAREHVCVTGVRTLLTEQLPVTICTRANRTQLWLTTAVRSERRSLHCSHTTGSFPKTQQRIKSGEELGLRGCAKNRKAHHPPLFTYSALKQFERGAQQEGLWQPEEL